MKYLEDFYNVCECDVPGYPLPDHGECSKCGLEMLDREGDGHWSDCATHNEPAYPNGKCDCGGIKPEKKNTFKTVDSVCHHWEYKRWVGAMKHWGIIINRLNSYTII